MRLVTILKAYTDWLDKVWNSYDKPAEPRPWCDLGLKEFGTENITEAFDRTQLNADYKSRYVETDINKKKPFTYIGAEIDALYGFQKGLISRHRSRLQMYRDDAAQKRFNTRTVIAQAEGEFIQSMRLSDYPIE